MRYIQPGLEFYQVKVSRRVEDVLPWMEAVAARGAEFWTRDKKRPAPREEWADIVQAWIQEDRHPLAEWRVSLSLRFEDLPEVFLHFSITQFNDGGNKFEIGTLLDFEFKDERHLVEPTAQRILELSRLLYPMTQPWFGFIDANNPILPRDVLKRRLKHVGWVNFFGPPYVEKYGRDFLLALPGYKTELLPDGGVFHQLSPTFVAADEAEARRLRQAVIASCRQHGSKVTCFAPYVIPGLTRLTPPEEPLDDAQLILYLDHVLPATLVLDDGARLKRLYIPWRHLSGAQREMTLARLKQALIAEVKRGGWKRLRLEFNELPAELEQMLLEVFGSDNPDVEWVEAAMGEA
ncbi:MAG: hypothetical protein KatS3mg051_2275 [Anaerolineae bacterium]|nr:MAG: hypothetical protein KatS3mg051_2275 [Anaerolineae bacterium]